MTTAKQPDKQAKTLWIAAALSGVAAMAAFAFYMTRFDADNARVRLIQMIPIWLEVNFVLIAIAFAVNYRSLFSVFTTMEKRHKYYLSAILLFALISSCFIAPRVHRIFYDENIYLNIGQNIAYLGKASMCNDGDNTYGVYKCTTDEFNKQPYAYPFMLGLMFRLAGSSETMGFLLNNLFFCLSAFTAFLIGRYLFKDIRAALFSSTIYALIPHNIMWGNTTAVEPSTALFTAVTLLSLLHYLKERDRAALFLFSVALPFSLQFRFESVLIIPVLLMAIALYDWKILKSGEFYLFMLIALALVLVHMLHLYTVRGDSWGASGDKMSLSFMLNNLKSNGMFYLNNKRFPMMFTVLAVCGIACKKTLLKERLIVSVWFLLFWGVFLTFYAGSYDYGQDVRYSVVSYMPLALLAGLGLFRLLTAAPSTKYTTAAAAIILFIIYSSSLPYVRAEGEEAWECRADYREAKKMLAMVDMENSVILTHNPSMFLIWGANAAQTSTLTYNLNRMNYFFDRYGQNVYFHYNYWCNVDNPVQKKFCQDMCSVYDCQQIAYHTEQNKIFALYRVKRK